MSGLDWSGVLGDATRDWLITGFLTTVFVTLAASLLATVLAVLLLGLRIAPGRLTAGLAAAITELFRNTPLLVQLFLWYFAAYPLVPASWREAVNSAPDPAPLGGGVLMLTPEFIVSAWGLGVFAAVFIAEEMRAGLRAVPRGQGEAARSQGFGPWATLWHILLPQALRNAFQPIIGQYLTLMKLSSLASAIGLAEITYQVRQIESYNAHALEAFAAGTLLYLALGLVIGRALAALAPRRPGGTAREARHGA